MTMSRTRLAYLLMVPMAVTCGLLTKALDLGSWIRTVILVAGGLLVTLVDREGFYGVEPRAEATDPSQS